MQSAATLEAMRARPRVGAQTFVCGIGAPTRLRGVSGRLAVFAYRRRARTRLLLEHLGHGVDLANVVQREHVLDRHLRARGALGSRSSKVAALMGSAPAVITARKHER